MVWVRRRGSEDKKSDRSKAVAARTELCHLTLETSDRCFTPPIGCTTQAGLNVSTQNSMQSVAWFAGVQI